MVSIAGGGTFRSAIASARAPQSTVGGGGAGPIRARTAGVGRAARTEATAPYRSQRPTRAPESVFDRLGEDKVPYIEITVVGQGAGGVSWNDSSAWSANSTWFV